MSVAYACKTPIGDKNATSPVKINAKKNGGSFDLTVKFSKSVMDSPADIPADSVKPSMEVKLGGADKGTVHVEGPTNKEPIKSGDPIEIPDLTGTYKPGASGKSTLSPGVLTVMALGTTTTCTPPADVAVSLELDTSSQPGGARRRLGRGRRHERRRYGLRRRTRRHRRRGQRHAARARPGGRYGDPAGRRRVHVHPWRRLRGTR